jgi:hypothetical protein
MKKTSVPYCNSKVFERVKVLNDLFEMATLKLTELVKNQRRQQFVRDRLRNCDDELQMSSKRTPVPRARPEDPLSGCPSADPSPKKQKTCAAPVSPQGSSRSKRSRLEEQLACSAAELRYIDSQSPENQQVAFAFL